MRLSFEPRYYEHNNLYVIILYLSIGSLAITETKYGGVYIDEIQLR